MACCSKTFRKTYFIVLQNILFINKAQQPIIWDKIKEFTKSFTKFSGFFISPNLVIAVIISLDHTYWYVWVCRVLLNNMTKEDEKDGKLSLIISLLSFFDFKGLVFKSRVYDYFTCKRRVQNSVSYISISIIV